VGFAATLDDLSFPELLHLISFNKKSGRLTLTCQEGHALVVFREGRILYAASNRLRESFAYVLLKDGAVTEQDLAEALERQNRLEHDHLLGRSLVQKGLIAPEEAEKALRQQAQWVITEVFQWRSGFFKFEPPDDGESENATLAADHDATDAGFDTEELLLAAATVMDEAGAAGDVRSDDRRRRPRSAEPFRVPPEWGGGRAASWNSLLHEIRSPSYTGEVVLTVLRYAAQVVSRGVFLLVSAHEALSIGQFGIESAERSARRVWIPLSEPSVFLDVIRGKRSFRGALPQLFWNDHFLEQLGSHQPREAVVVPMVVDERTAFVFYGDNLPSGAPIGSIQGLEFLMAEAARAMETFAWDGTTPARRGRRRSDA
jgi:hypothetical protein